MNPIEIAPQGTFAEFIKSEPFLGAAVDQFVIALYGDNGIQLGWLGENDDGWAILVDTVEQAVNLELYPYDQVNYYRIKDTSRYMSVSRNGYVGFYNWSGATGWTLNGNNLVSDYSGQKLSLYSTDNQYIYAWDKYNVLTVKLNSN